MTKLYLDPDQKVIVDMGLSKVVVSWPGGYKVLTYEDHVLDLLGTVKLAIADLLAERPTHAQVRKARTKHYDEGFDAGWSAAKVVAKQAVS